MHWTDWDAKQNRVKKKAKSDNFEIEKWHKIFFLLITEEPQAQELILNYTATSNLCIMQADIKNIATEENFKVIRLAASFDVKTQWRADPYFMVNYWE